MPIRFERNVLSEKVVVHLALHVFALGGWAGLLGRVKDFNCPFEIKILTSLVYWVWGSSIRQGSGWAGRAGKDAQFLYISCLRL